jgi:hypothetical protein
MGGSRKGKRKKSREWRGLIVCLKIYFSNFGAQTPAFNARNSPVREIGVGSGRCS